MKIQVEIYKGIEFVRISSLPKNQKDLISNSFNTQKIIKILRDGELLNDCIRYADYQGWYQECFNLEIKDERSQANNQAFKFAFK